MEFHFDEFLLQDVRRHKRCMQQEDIRVEVFLFKYN